MHLERKLALIFLFGIAIQSRAASITSFRYECGQARVNSSLSKLEEDALGIPPGNSVGYGIRTVVSKLPIPSDPSQFSYDGSGGKIIQTLNWAGSEGTPAIDTDVCEGDTVYIAMIGGSQYVVGDMIFLGYTILATATTTFQCEGPTLDIRAPAFMCLGGTGTIKATALDCLPSATVEWLKLYKGGSVLATTSFSYPYFNTSTGTAIAAGDILTIKGHYESECCPTKDGEASFTVVAPDDPRCVSYAGPGTPTVTPTATTVTVPPCLPPECCPVNLPGVTP